MHMIPHGSFRNIIAASINVERKRSQGEVSAKSSALQGGMKEINKAMPLARALTNERLAPNGHVFTSAI